MLLPQLAPGILGGALLAFVISMDDLVITCFLAGIDSTTLPVLIFGMVRRGVKPGIDAHRHPLHPGLGPDRGAGAVAAQPKGGPTWRRGPAPATWACPLPARRVDALDDRHLRRPVPRRTRLGHAVLAEAYDGVLGDIDAMFVEPRHARAAIKAARGGPGAEGPTGNGMIAYGFKGGTGTSSRRVAIGGDTCTVGALAQASHGLGPWLTIPGRPVGRLMPEGALHGSETGAIIVPLGTDAPLSALSPRALAKRAAIGIGRGGTPGGHNSGDVFLAFSVASPGPMPQSSPVVRTMPRLNGEHLDPLHLAAVEAVEEAAVNAPVAGEDAETVAPAGRTTCRALDARRLAELFRAS